MRAKRPAILGEEGGGGKVRERKREEEQEEEQGEERGGGLAGRETVQPEKRKIVLPLNPHEKGVQKNLIQQTEYKLKNGIVRK